MPDGSPKVSRGFAGMTAVTATYVYFLLFAQYGLVRLIESRGGAADAVQRAMTFMGIAGLVASFLTARLLAKIPARKLLLAGFAGCAAAALLALVPIRGFMEISAAMTGAFTGLLTVTLASCLRKLIPGPRFGLQAGTATGFAYFICNIPPLFDGPPVLQTIFCAAICGVGFIAILATRREALEISPAPACPSLRDDDLKSWGFASIILALLALVWLDSTAFATIQHTAGLKGRTWGGPSQQWLMGGTHFLAAVLAGALADKGWFRGLLAGTFLLFVLAFRMLAVWGIDAAAAGPLYAIGISTYSVALILFPSARPDSPGQIPARWRSAILYGIAGWFGSALGVGMAQHLHRLPAGLLVASGIVIATGIALANCDASRLLFRTAGLVAFGLIAGIVNAIAPRHDPNSDPVARGREVYREEQCITCHSQFIRPHTRDVERWGPFHEPDMTEKPPFISNRRQGPDLMNVGLRRTPEWQKQHLLAPQAIVPGSRMPSYSHLFADDSTRGDDLVAYLFSLGQKHAAARYAMIRDWKPPAGIVADAAHGKEIFETFCTPCHGPAGCGDGPQARNFFRPAINLRKGSFFYTATGFGSAQELDALQRIARFGVPGTSMAGHESFTDQQVADVAAFVQQLAKLPIIGTKAPGSFQ